MKRFVVVLSDVDAGETIRLEYKSSVDISDLLDDLASCENPPQVVIEVVKY